MELSEVPKTPGKSNGGLILRQKSINEYYDNPSTCLNCNSVIKVGCSEKVRNVKRKKFCNNSCSASYNNKIRKRTSSKRTCEHCGGLKSYDSKMCQKCRVELKTLKIETQTKGELFSSAANWQSARSRIAAHARKVLSKNADKKCKVCGYSLNVHCCHIKDVSEFDDDVLITEINDINNLCWLCPNHHWEFDNGHLSFK